MSGWKPYLEGLNMTQPHKIQLQQITVSSNFQTTQ